MFRINSNSSIHLLSSVHRSLTVSLSLHLTRRSPSFGPPENLVMKKCFPCHPDKAHKLNSALGAALPLYIDNTPSTPLLARFSSLQTSEVLAS